MTLRARRAWRVAVAAACGVASRTSLSDAQAAGRGGRGRLCHPVAPPHPRRAIRSTTSSFATAACSTAQGNPWILADVAIKDGRFAKIGKITGARRNGDRRARAST